MHWQLIAESNFWFLGYLWPIAQMIIGIGLIIFVHELGHFLAAKACGVKCEKFYVGFDAFDLNLGVFTIPRRLFHFQWGETEYGIGILPLGGYVRMLGQHDNPAEAEAERERAQKEGKLDPRSYMAKTVPQRMLIISAGVIMNIIFGVIFATTAFFIGVEYPPTQIGAVTSGSPAWENNLSDIDITKINQTDTTDRYYSFMHLVEAVAIGSGSEGTELEFKRAGKENQTETLTIKPELGFGPKKDLPFAMIGVGPASIPKLGINKETLSPGGVAKDSDLKPKDLITHVNGEKVETGAQLVSAVRKHWNQPLELTVLRGVDPKKENSGETVKVEVKQNPIRGFGLTMKYGPIKRIRKNSPVAQMSPGKPQILKGDKLEKIDGKPINPMLVGQQLREYAQKGESVTLTVSRPSTDKDNAARKELDVEITPSFPGNSTQQHYHTPMVVDEIGVAFFVLNQVAAVEPGSAAEKAGFQNGDVITKISEAIEDKKERAKIRSLITISEKNIANAWPRFFAEMNQRGSIDSTYNFVVKRDDRTVEFSMKPSIIENMFSDSRGFSMQHKSEIYVSKDLSDAFANGSWQTWRDCTKIFRTLSGLVKGEIPITALGGLPTIAMGATSEAKAGFPRLLLFLTLISANLAVVNFLPIPILDGGHMVFLIWEGITGNPPNEKVHEGLSIAGGLLILSLLLFTFGLDFFRIFNMFSGS